MKAEAYSDAISPFAENANVIEVYNVHSQSCIYISMQYLTNRSSHNSQTNSTIDCQGKETNNSLTDLYERYLRDVI